MIRATLNLMVLKWRESMRQFRKGLAIIFAMIFLSACNPTVRIQAPEKPIEINMKITIDIKIAVEKQLDKMLNEDSGLF